MRNLWHQEIGFCWTQKTKKHLRYYRYYQSLKIRMFANAPRIINGNGDILTVPRLYRRYLNDRKLYLCDYVAHMILEKEQTNRMLKTLICSGFSPSRHFSSDPLMEVMCALRENLIRILLGFGAKIEPYHYQYYITQVNINNNNNKIAEMLKDSMQK